MTGSLRVGDSIVPTVLAEGFQAGFTTDLVIALTGLCVALVLLRPLTRGTRDMTSAGSGAEPSEGPPHP